jgi:hypothetical protein
MRLRIALHCTSLLEIELFYTHFLGLSVLGKFINHDSYDGLFLGYQDSDWHLEFTSSSELPKRVSDEDDALVFYLGSTIEMDVVKDKIKRANRTIQTPKNPYWQNNGLMITDPDGVKIIFTKTDYYLTQNDNLTTLGREKSGIYWSDLLEYVRLLPYGRNSNREELSLVLSENRGTCSSKHALLRKIAELNGIKGVQLFLGLYKMNQINTPKIGALISEAGLDYIPEAHCYLKLNGHRIDITMRFSKFTNIENDLIEEFEIKPEQVSEYKVEYHQKYLKQWISDYDIPIDFEGIWKIREQCIRNMGL